jgi:hypothetical protein
MLKKILNFDFTSYSIRETFIICKWNQGFSFNWFIDWITLIWWFRGCSWFFWTKFKFCKKISWNLRKSNITINQYRMIFTFVPLGVIVFGCSLIIAGGGFLSILDTLNWGYMTKETYGLGVGAVCRLTETGISCLSDLRRIFRFTRSLSNSLNIIWRVPNDKPRFSWIPEK